MTGSASRRERHLKRLHLIQRRLYRARGSKGLRPGTPTDRPLCCDFRGKTAYLRLGQRLRGKQRIDLPGQYRFHTLSSSSSTGTVFIHRGPRPRPACAEAVNTISGDGAGTAVIFSTSVP